MTTENNFPTIRDLRDQLTALVDAGFGALPVQIVVAPDSTMQVLARADGHDGGAPALMIEYPREGRQIGVAFISADRLSRSGVPSLGAH